MKKRESLLVHLNHDGDGYVIKVYYRYIIIFIFFVILTVGGNLLFFRSGGSDSLKFRLTNITERNREMASIIDSVNNEVSDIDTVLSAMVQANKLLDSITAISVDKQFLVTDSVVNSFTLSFLSSYSDTLLAFIKNFSEDIDKDRSLIQSVPVLAPIKGENFAVMRKYGIEIDPFTEKNKIHQGIDYAAKIGTPVVATANGIVVSAKKDQFWGNRVIIKHKNRVQTVYAHLGKISVKSGKRIYKGDKLGTVGMSGWSSGPHVHYEVRVDGKPVNPARFMELN